jgi:hypothetical protein
VDRRGADELEPNHAVASGDGAVVCGAVIVGSSTVGGCRWPS